MFLTAPIHSYAKNAQTFVMKHEKNKNIVLAKNIYSVLIIGYFLCRYFSRKVNG